MRNFLFLISFVFASVSFAQVTIKGFAPTYIGESIEAYRVLDFLSEKEALIGSAKVDSDSTFTLYIESPITQKIILKGKNNKGFLLVQPNARYSVFFPEKDKYTPNRPAGNLVEIAFYDLDSTDINYKVLGFQRWVDHFLGNNYYLKSNGTDEFAKSLERFKTRVESAYKNDTSMFFKTHVRFTIAGLDNIPNIAERNRYEKYDFYLKKTPVAYANETYMLYIKEFYQKLMPRLSSKTNQAVYEGILKSSPTIIMKALGTDYTMSNLRLREIAMIQALSEVYNSGDYPQTNILTILDSLSNRCLFEANTLIAQNMRARLTDLVPGGKAPDFVLTAEGMPTKTLFHFQKKYLYIHFFDPESLESAKELPLLAKLVTEYGENIQFVSIYKKKQSYSELAKERLEEVTWDKYELGSENSIWNNYQVEVLPHYVLIDAAGYIVASPALTPTPNGQHETIDRTFFYIQKGMKEESDR